MAIAAFLGSAFERAAKQQREHDTANTNDAEQDTIALVTKLFPESHEASYRQISNGSWLICRELER